MRHALLTAAFLGAASLLPFASPAEAADRRVEVVNASGRTMTEFYASNTNRSSWEEDILGNDVLPAGRSVTINIDDGSGACRFDFHGGAGWWPPRRAAQHQRLRGQPPHGAVKPSNVLLPAPWPGGLLPRSRSACLKNPTCLDTGGKKEIHRYAP
jgi:hypothetical protein